MPPASETTTPVDLRLRLIALALEPALSLAHTSALPLDDLQALVTTGYFRTLRGRGLSLRAVALRMRKSLRTVATLSKRASQARPFMQLGDRVTLRRKLAAYITAHGPVEEARLRSVARDSRVDVELTQLCDEGIVERKEGRFSVTAAQLNLVSEDLEPRLDSVRHLLEVVSHTIHQRFFVADPGVEAFARVLSFAARRDALSTLRTRHYAQLRDAVVAADHDAGAGAIAAAVAVCVVELPKERKAT